jgi:two-component system LytT family response regulator
MIKAIVIDDEKPSREVICNYLKEFCIDIKVIATAASVKTAFKTISKFSPDLIFLDIEMGDGKGFDLLRMFDKIDFKVIFVTAYSEHAIKAFRINAIDYLLKPIKIEELKDAVEKVRNLDRNLKYEEALSELLQTMSGNNSHQPTIVIHHIKGFEVLKVNDIIMCKADGYCTNLILTGKRKVISSKNLKHFEEILFEHNFIRVHHSFLVNINYVCSCTKQGEILLTEDNKASLGDSYKNGFMSRFENR